MATEISGTVNVGVSWTRKDTTNPLGTINDGQSTLTFKKSLAAGSGNNQINQKWAQRITVVSGTPYDLDLTALAETVFGDSASVGFSAVKVLQIINNGLADADVLSVGGGSNPFIPWLLATGDGVKIGPDGCFLLVARKLGYTVTGGTGDILRISHSAGHDISVDVLIEGVS